MFKNEKTLQINGEFPSLTITIFPSFKIKKTNEIIQRTLIFNIVM
jgi:hypothetical protein